MIFSVLFTTRSLISIKIKEKAFDHIVEKGENPDNIVWNYTTQNLFRITFSFNDLMLKTNRLKKDLFYKDRLIFGLDDPVANMLIRHVYYA